jgi:hypothetical protein
MQSSLEGPLHVAQPSQHGSQRPNSFNHLASFPWSGLAPVMAAPQAVFWVTDKQSCACSFHSKVVLHLQSFLLSGRVTRFADAVRHVTHDPAVLPLHVLHDGSHLIKLKIPANVVSGWSLYATHSPPTFSTGIAQSHFVHYVAEYPLHSAHVG